MSTKATRRVVVYEYTCSGGLLSSEHSYDAASLMREGWAMLRALATDLSAISGVHVQTLADHRGLPGALPDCELIAVLSPAEERSLLTEHAKLADWTVIVAPETDGALIDRCRWVEAAGGRLLGAASSLVDLLGDKHRTAEYLGKRGLRFPSGTAWRPEGFKIRVSAPLVVKPLDGAGSQATYLVSEQQTLDSLLADLPRRHPRQHSWRIEAFRRGVPVSVAALCGPRGTHLLPPCYQRIKLDTTIAYCGGSCPIDPTLRLQAVRLATGALRRLPALLGFIGIDMVLGDDPDGRDDCVIEINPRLTTSYVGLRAASRTNLAKAMLDVAAGEMLDLSFDETPLEFDTDGTVRLVECGGSSPRSFSIDVAS